MSTAAESMTARECGSATSSRRTPYWFLTLIVVCVAAVSGCDVVPVIEDLDAGGTADASSSHDAAQQTQHDGNQDAAQEMRDGSNHDAAQPTVDTGSQDSGQQALDAGLDATGCAEDTFDHDGDPATPCAPWTICEAGSYVAAAGTNDKDRVCEECEKGTFSTDPGAEACAVWTVCVAGQHILTQGSSTQDRTCAVCPSGTFSSDGDSLECGPWSDCAVGSYVAAPGSSTADRRCTGFAVTSPSERANVRGQVTFTVSLDDPRGVDAVEYLLDGRPISGPLYQAPFAYVYNSFWLSDGPHEIVAQAIDRRAEPIGKTEPVPFRIRNDRSTIDIVSPARQETWADTVALEYQIDFEIQDTAGHRAEGVMIFIDGVEVERTHRLGFQQDPAVPLTDTLSIDTRRFGNGSHELTISVFECIQPSGPVDGTCVFTNPGMPQLMLQREIEIDNGNAIGTLGTNLSEIRGAPGSVHMLSGRWLHTNGDWSAAPGASFVSTDRAVAAVDQSGRVTLLQDGVTTIVVTLANGEGVPQEVRVRVVADSFEGIPHFSERGELRSRYVAGGEDPSLFVRSFFSLQPDTVSKDLALLRAAREAEINTLETGFYVRPRPSHAGFDGWRTEFDAKFELHVPPASELGFSVLLFGDDVARRAVSMDPNIHLAQSWAPHPVAYAMERAADPALRVIGVEMVDETNGIWGDTPFPNDDRWMSMDPPIPNDAFETLLGYIRDDATRAPAITWPVHSKPEAVIHWLGNPLVSDYSTLFPTFLAWRAAYSYGASLAQLLHNSWEIRVLGVQGLVQLDRPQLMLVSSTGPFYYKQVEGSEYQPGLDQLGGAGVRPETVAGSIAFAAISGMAGVRTYSFDFSGWKNKRQDQPPQAYAPGNPGLQTGCDPFETGTDIWHAWASASRWVARLESLILAEPIDAPYLGDSIVTGARRGDESVLVMAANFTEAGQRVKLELSDYLALLPCSEQSQGCPIALYRLSGYGYRSEPVELAAGPTPEGGMQMELVLSRGEAVAIVLGGERARDAYIGFARPAPGGTLGVSSPLRVMASAEVDTVSFYVDGQLVGTASPTERTNDPTSVPAVMELLELEADLTGFTETPWQNGRWHGFRAVALHEGRSTGEAYAVARIQR